MFSHEEYKQIIRKYKDIIVDYKDVSYKDSFCLIRHDVEFDIDRALAIAKIDSLEGIQSSFLFQVRSNAYNLFSLKNYSILEEIKSYGHHIGLHLLVSDSVEENDWAAVFKELQYQKLLLEKAINSDVDRFSFHRPKPWMLKKRRDYIFGVLNLYGPSFFEFSDQPKDIKYFADSRHRWAYGHPLDDTKLSKFQLLLHPDEWSEDGYDTDKNFDKLIENHTDNFEVTMFEETIYKNNER